MHAIRTAINVAWIIFWLYWLLSAIGAKQRTGGGRRFRLTGLSVVSVLLLVHVFSHGSLAVDNRLLAAIGLVVFASGIALAVWARIYLGRNWGMPMTQKADPELVTSGPYRFVRHPIYAGLLAGVLGTAMANSLVGLIIFAILGGYFYYCASMEEKNLTATFPAGYPPYRSNTKMLVPFVL